MQTLYRLVPSILAILFFLATAADAGPIAFVTDRSENTLSIIDISDGTLLQTVPTGRGPQGLALSHDGKLIYITQSLDDAVLVLSTSDFSTRKSITTAGAPTDISVSPDGQLLYVACHDRINVIRTADDTIVESISAVREPAGLALTPDGRILYVTSTVQGTLTVINTRDLTPSAVIDLGSAVEPSAIRVAPGGDFLYVTGLSSTKILVLATGDFSIKASIDLGLEPSAIAFSPDGTFAYAQHAKADVLSEIRTSDHRLIGKKPYGSLSLDAGAALTYTAAYESPAGGIAIPIVGAITTPTFLNASSAGLSQINLYWTDNSDNETGFAIERRTSESAFGEIYRVGANITYYRDTGLDSFTTYYYRVRAYNTSTGEYSPYSNEASATTNVTDDDNDWLFCSVSYILKGTPFNGHMNKLRKFRDQVLMKSGMGKTFVKFYYSLSPGLVKVFQKYDILKQISKALLIPLIYIILYPALLILLPIFFIFPFLLRRFRTHASTAA
ncbi:MAG: beta-propeller fold lactonase family protein [Deltaproteobacteria bacterium]|nr:beta-propeller fold lactonase family protein [Deltaproteobacteria bacterium]